MLQTKCPSDHIIALKSPLGSCLLNVRLIGVGIPRFFFVLL